MKFKTTVIIPCKNRPDLLARAVRSVLSQTSPARVIVVDDGSHPPLSKRVPVSPQVKVIRHPKSLGPAAARNTGLKQVKTEYVSFLDSDDMYRREFLAECLLTLNTQPGIIGTLTLSHKQFLQKFTLLSRLKLITYNLIKDLLVLFAYITNRQTLPSPAAYLTQISHLVFRHKPIIGLMFDTKLKFCEDWMFMLDVMEKGKIHIKPARLIIFSYSPTSYIFSQNKKKSIPKANYYRILINRLDSQFPKSKYVSLFKMYTSKLLIQSA